jgi:TfoX/Sxy family transcriptional regulator of competence genes
LRDAGARGEQEPKRHSMKKRRGKKTKRAEKEEVDARFAPVARAFAGVRGVSAGKLFSSYGLEVNGKIFAMFGRGRLVVKLPKEQVDGLVSAKKAERFDPGH